MKLVTALGRLLRLRKLRKAAKKRSEELFARGLRGLDEEDGIVSYETQEANVVSDLREWGVGGVVD